MTHTLSITTDIPDTRRVQIDLPPSVPSGEADMVIVIVPKGEHRHCTGQDLLDSELFGMWADRTDIPDSVTYARELRARAWRRA